MTRFLEQVHSSCLWISMTFVGVFLGVALGGEPACAQSQIEKVGPVGVGSDHQIRPEQLIPYRITFENPVTVAAPVREVQVIDALDAGLDPNTVTMGAIQFGDRTVEPPPGLNAYSVDVDLRPGTNLIVRVQLNVDPPTGMLAWFLQSIDPDTGEPPADTSIGFLPPNQNPPEGEVALQFTVLPRQGLTNGTVIRNTAAVRFDGNTPVLSPEWSNVINDALAVDTRGPWSFSLMGARPNPVNDAVKIWFTLPSATPATLDVLDVTGRRVSVREVGSLGPGVHSIDLKDGVERPGVYFLRLTQGTLVSWSRMTVIR